MPAFMFISGWFCYNKPISWKTFIKTTVLFLLLPLLLWDTVIMVIDYVMGTFRGFSNIIVSLWYIKCLIIIRFITLPFLRWPNFFTGLIVVLVGLVIGQYYLISLLIPSFLCGYIFHRYMLFDFKFVWITALIVFISELIFIHPSIETTNLAVIKNIEPTFILNYINRLLIGLSGAVIFIATIRSLTNTSLNKLVTIGKVTMGIYILQCIIAERLLCKVTSSVNDFTIYVLLAIATTIVCYIIVIVFKKSRFANFIIGK